MELARERSASIFAVVGRDGGFAARVADACVLIPTHVPGSGHTAHGRSVRSDLAPPREPPNAGEEPDQVGGGQVRAWARSGLSRVFLVGGAGFIGSHFVDRLLAESSTESVTVYDNFSSGREWYLEHHVKDSRLRVVRSDAAELDQLVEAMRGSQTVIHLASNPDIARATEPSIDFDSGTVLTQHVVEAMRRSAVKRILYASGSGVYGDLGDVEADEDHGPLFQSRPTGRASWPGRRSSPRTAPCSA